MHKLVSFRRNLHSSTIQIAINKLLSDTNAKTRRLFSEASSDQKFIPLRKDFSFIDRETNLPPIDYKSSFPRVIGEASSKWNGGKLLCVSHGNGWRTLQFGEEPKYVQSGVRCFRENINDPQDCEVDGGFVACGYIRTMGATGLSFLKYLTKDAFEESRILIVGLGAGSLPNFIAKYFPSMTIDVVDIDQSVFHFAKQYFGFKETPNLNVIIKDIREHIENCRSKYDAIFIDAFDHQGMLEESSSTKFLKQCRQALRYSHGIVVSNLHTAAPSFSKTVLQFDISFFSKFNFFCYETYLNPTYALGVEFEGNAVIVGSLTRKKIPKSEILKAAKQISSEKNIYFNLEHTVSFGYEFAPNIRSENLLQF